MILPACRRLPSPPPRAAEGDPPGDGTVGVAGAAEADPLPAVTVTGGGRRRSSLAAVSEEGVGLEKRRRSVILPGSRHLPNPGSARPSPRAEGVALKKRGEPVILPGSRHLPKPRSARLRRWGGRRRCNREEGRKRGEPVILPGSCHLPNPGSARPSPGAEGVALEKRGEHVILPGSRHLPNPGYARLSRRGSRRRCTREEGRTRHPPRQSPSSKPGSARLRRGR